MAVRYGFNRLPAFASCPRQALLSNRLFLEMLPGYELDKKSDGILKANTLRAPKVKAEILPGLSSARSQLMTFESPFGVPAVCSALLAERAAMAFVGASIGETETIRLVYRQYLEKQRQTCTTARERLQKSQATIWTQLAQVATEKRICMRQDTAKGSSVDGCYRGSYVVQLAGSTATRERSSIPRRSA